MKWKVLKFGTEYVDVNRLHSGIYTTHHPVLHEESITIDGMIEVAKNLQSILGWSDEQVTAYSENIKRCSLVEVALSESPSPSLQEAGIIEQMNIEARKKVKARLSLYSRHIFSEQDMTSMGFDMYLAGWNARDSQQDEDALKNECIQFLQYYKKTAMLSHGSTGENVGLGEIELYNKYKNKP